MAICGSEEETVHPCPLFGVISIPPAPFRMTPEVRPFRNGFPMPFAYAKPGAKLLAAIEKIERLHFELRSG